MRLLVPTNWDEGLIASLSKIRADVQIYGALPVSLMGSGGSGPDIPLMTTGQAEDYIASAQSSGLTFNYLLNAPCLNNLEWREESHRELITYLEWLESIGVDSVTVAIPFLLEIIKKRFPRLKVEVSTIAHVNSVARAQHFESLGADTIMLDYNINRDFDLLESIRSSVDCELGVLTNTLCLYQCPYEYYHNNTLGHASQSGNMLNGHYVDYCSFRCSLSRYDDPAQFIKARWIRPEDLDIYQQMGMDFFKIGGRSMPTDWIVNVAKAYAEMKYEGNLYDLLNPLAPKTANAASSMSSEQAAVLSSLPDVHIDNQALDGFADFFRNQNCLAGCGQCNYCQEIADKVVRFEQGRVGHYVTALKKFLSNLSSGRLFNPVSA